MAHEDDLDDLELRRRARAEQATVLQRRLERHQAIAARLLADPVGAADLIGEAQAVVTLWRAERICSDDYSDAWTVILAKAPAEIAAAIVSDAEGWDALRQCSPWTAGPDG